ncbi:MAG TPA: succinate dehydrogenase cytochrome b subunit [Candidatus Krumholzibacteria bacterium]|mgnify:CR=1 FL=1|nr:succinate dehydrogenase cytochrome b subunit [Candidatus Krumholzibacteria bacterium]HRX51596.1 succinate dehydrogenase cytochrome b subunit [Candidatus Krumholzibacteria bacterium]
MTTFRSAAWSSVGKKVITGVTGLLLVGFVIAHLVGNLTLFIPDGGHAFNAYAHFLETAVHGWLIYAFEIGLITIFLFHMVAAVTVAWKDKTSARPKGYAVVKNAGGKSRKSLNSRSMIITGIVLIVFVVLHVNMFKFADHGLVTYEAGKAVPVTLEEGAAHHPEGAVKDLYTTVVAAFKQPVIAGIYVLVMILLGMHLRHGFWSAFQSLGWNSDRHMDLLQNAARVVSVLLAVGFLILPLFILFFVDANAAGGH